MDHGLRRTALAARLDELEVDALLITDLSNLRYLTGFTGSNGALVLGPDQGVFLTDGRYDEQSRREVDDVERVIGNDGPQVPVAEVAARLGVRRLGVEASHVTLAAHDRLITALEAIEVVPVEGAVEHHRRVKDAEELAAIERAQQATDDAFDEVLEQIAVGISELQVARFLEQALRRDGGDGLAFPSVVAFGENAAEPHHQPAHRLLEEGDVVKLDFGALRDGYHADMTRTVAFGAPAAELRKIHDVVRQAQQAGIDAVSAGASAGDVDAAARGVIAAAGFGDRFTHGLGHGVGLEIHEAPWLRSGIDGRLPAGAVVTIEPGIYVPALGGVRIEDMVVVTDEGCRVLGTSTRELIEL